MSSARQCLLVLDKSSAAAPQHTARCWHDTRRIPDQPAILVTPVAPAYAWHFSSQENFAYSSSLHTFPCCFCCTVLPPPPKPVYHIFEGESLTDSPQAHLAERHRSTRPPHSVLYSPHERINPRIPMQ